MEEDLDDLFENAPCGYVSTRPDGRIIKANHTLATWLGKGRDQLVQQRFQDLLNIAGKIYYETHFAPLLRMQGYFNEVALDLVGQEGRVLPVLVNAVERRNAAGDVRFIRITVFNASDRRRYERELLEARRSAEAASNALRELNLTLEARVAAAIEQRMHAEEALRQIQKMEAIGQLTGGIAHDFNNLLAVIVGQTEGIIAAADGDTRLVRMANAIHRAADRGAQLIGHLLAFSRRQKLRPTRVAFENIATTVNDFVRNAVGDAVEVEFSAGPALWPALADPVQFESALLNLAVNARDAMPGGGRVVITARNATVAGAEAARLDLAPSDYVVVSVADTGPGMPPEVRERAFEPFFTTKDIGKGTGLGLAQTYGFAKQSGGAVTIDSTPGHGTTVSLYLPKAEPSATEEAPSLSDEAPLKSHGKTVLVVEDQPEVREVIEMSLTVLGYRTLTAPDGITARKLLMSDETIDLLVTDVMMPNGVSGVDLALEAYRLRQDLKILLVSGLPRDLNARARSLPEEFAFLRKPFRQNELAAAIASAFNGAGTTAPLADP